MRSSPPRLEHDNELYTVVWFDPGGTTGWAVIAVPPEVMGPPPFERWCVETLGWQPTTVSYDPSSVETARIQWKAAIAAAANYRILDNVVWWSCGQFNGWEDDQADAMRGLVDEWRPGCVVGCEDFILRALRPGRELLSPVRITAAFKHELRAMARSQAIADGHGQADPPNQSAWAQVLGGATGASRPHLWGGLNLQPASLAMTMAPDERLRRWSSGVYYNGTAGAPHARDAVRHGLTWLRREKEARSLGRSLETSAALFGVRPQFE